MHKFGPTTDDGARAIRQCGSVRAPRNPNAYIALGLVLEALRAALLARVGRIRCNDRNANGKTNA